MIYITEMLRFGKLESHHYIIGAYTSKDAAIFAGEVEKSWRGGKYDYQVIASPIDAVPDTDKYEYHTQCYVK